MPFYANNSGYIETRRAPAPACTCDTSPPANGQGADMVKAMMALVVNAKIDRALERASQVHTHGTGQPLIPRGLVGQHSATERATGPLVAHGVADAARRQEPAHSAPLRPRGLLAGGR
jgi:hypothetical protein